MSTKEHFESSESMTTQTEPELPLGATSNGSGSPSEGDAKVDLSILPTTGLSKKKTSPILGGSPDRYCEVRTLIQR